MLDLYVRDPLVPGQVLKFADATGLELAQKREELGRRIDELHVKIASWERDPKVAPADVAARRQELATLEAQREALDTQAAARQGQLLPLLDQGDARLARQGPGRRGGPARLLQGGRTSTTASPSPIASRRRTARTRRRTSASRRARAAIRGRARCGTARPTRAPTRRSPSSSRSSTSSAWAAT